MAVLVVAWGFVSYFGLNTMVSLLGRTDPARQGDVLVLNSAASYAGALADAVLLGAAYGEGRFQLVARLAVACAAGASIVPARLVMRPATRKGWGGFAPATRRGPGAAFRQGMASCHA